MWTDNEAGKTERHKTVNTSVVHVTTNEWWNGQDVVREWHTCKEEEGMWARERAQWLRVPAILAGDCILFPEPMWHGSYLSITPGPQGPIPLFSLWRSLHSWVYKQSKAHKIYIKLNLLKITKCNWYGTILKRSPKSWELFANPFKTVPQWLNHYFISLAWSNSWDLYTRLSERNFIFQLYIKTRCENFHMVVFNISFNIEGNKRFFEKASKV